MAFFSLITKHLLKSKNTANDLNARKRNSRKRQTEKDVKYESVKQGPAENMTAAVLKELLKDKGIAFSSKAKTSELVDLFNAAHHTSGRPGCMKVRVPVATLPFTVAAYDGSVQKFKQFFFVNKRLPQEISRPFVS